MKRLNMWINFDLFFCISIEFFLSEKSEGWKQIKIGNEENIIQDIEKKIAQTRFWYIGSTVTVIYSLKYFQNLLKKL